MPGEIKLNSVNFASESGGTITINNGTIGSAVAMSANHPAVKTALNASGSAPVYACRAWVNFDGINAFSPNPSTSAIRDSGNVSSIYQNGTGDYTINFETAMPSTSFCVSGMVLENFSSGGRSDRHINPTRTNFNTGYIRIGTFSHSTATLIDCQGVFVMVIA